MVLFRAAVKQIARRHGLLASFMCRPAFANVMSSGWHLHQSLVESKTARNAFAFDHPDVLSTVGKYYLGGLLAHARAAAALTTPTINGYKRYRPNSLRTRPRNLGARQSWRDDPRAGPTWRSPRPAWKIASASLQANPISTWLRKSIRSRRHRAQARSRSPPPIRLTKPPRRCCRKT
jgi:hypothetical protein